MSDLEYVVICHERYEGYRLLGITKSIESAQEIIREKSINDNMLNRHYWIYTDTGFIALSKDDACRSGDKV